jgi:hypothetical protein
LIAKSDVSTKWKLRVVFFAWLLFFFNIPHTLEDFATGMPAKEGIPTPILALVISILISLQALGLFWLGQEKRKGLFVLLGIGLFWPIASGLAQLPTILSEGASYRSGFISIFYVAGLIVVGLLLCISSIISLRSGSRTD